MEGNWRRKAGMYGGNDQVVAVLQGKRPMKCWSTRESIMGYSIIEVFKMQARLSILYSFVPSVMKTSYLPLKVLYY